jgi:hypothetical protein
MYNYAVVNSCQAISWHQDWLSYQGFLREKPFSGKATGMSFSRGVSTTFIWSCLGDLAAVAKR